MRHWGVVLLLLVCASVCFGDFEEYFVADFNRDLKVDLEDIQIFASQWLDPSGCAGRNDCADLDGVEGVNFKDLQIVAGRWMQTATTPIITEFCASNGVSLLDQDGESSDWIEIYNPLTHAVDLTGWTLTDDKGKPAKWAFPEITLGAGQYLVVFASNKDRNNPAEELHTNFVLDPDGEYLALVMDNGGTVAQAFEDYPRQFRDVSYGLTLRTVSNLEFGKSAYYKIPTANDPDDLRWTTGYSQTPWNSGILPFSFESGEGTDLSSAMQDVNASLQTFRLFSISSPEEVKQLVLNVKYDDGFKAYLNGIEVASRNAPALLTYNSTATATHDAGSVEQINLSDHLNLLKSGNNYFAFQALNITEGDSDFYLDFKVETTQLAPDRESERGYFAVPTPGAANGIADTEIGPKIDPVAHTPAIPADADELVVTATITETAAAVNPASVRLHYRVMYGPEVTVSMTDNGTGSDITAGDSIYTGVIPASAFSSKEMVRYYITASDIQAGMTRFPLYKSSQFSEQYRGTVVDGDSIQTPMDLFWWFVEDPDWYKYDPRGYTKDYISSSVFYKGRFYDNVQTRIRGASSIVHKFPKQSLKMEFNQENRFYYSPEMDKLDEINVNALSVDKGFIRNHLSMKAFGDSGSPYSTSDMWLCYQNGQFHSVVNFVEQVDEQYLKRNDLPANGALYKIFNYLDGSEDRPAWYPGVNPDTLDGVEKKTRQWEDNSDLQALVNGIKSSTNRAQFLFDNINIPEVINEMCGNIINQCWDRFEKNYYMYRDSEGSGEWSLLPWDQDLAWGYLGWMNDSLSGTHSGMSHPLYGEQEHPSAYGAWHRLDEAMLDNSTIREMYLRRLRTVLDEHFQAPGTPTAELKIEAYIDEMITKMADEVNADIDKWGVVWGTQRSFELETDRIKTDYLAPKRNTLYNTFGPGGQGPLPTAQVGNPAIAFGNFEATPGSTIIDDPLISPQDCEYIQLVNNNAFAVDISGWKLTGGVTFTFKPGTVIASSSSLYVSPNVKAFRMRNTPPTGLETNFVVGGYEGHLSAWGETVTLLAADGTVMDSFSYAPNPSDQQRYLRVSEIMYHPAPDMVTAFEDEDFEYIELYNAGPALLDLSGVRFTEGIEYVFSASASQETIDLLGYTDVWKYEQSDTDLGTSWRSASYDDTGWQSGPGLLYAESSALPAPKNTPLTLGPRTFYFRAHFNFQGDPSSYDTIVLTLSTVIDDGAVVYLNGQEIYRIGVDTSQTHDTLSNRTVGDAAIEGPFGVPHGSLLQGDNVLAVEIHQQSDGSSDVVWGCQLQAELTTQSQPAELPAGQYMVICKNTGAFSELYDDSSILIAPGNYVGSLSNSGETIKIEDITGSTIQSFSFKDGWYELTDGLGFSLTMPEPDSADPNAWDTRDGWRASLYEGGTPGAQAEAALPAGSIVISELLAHSHSTTNPDWIELHNTTGQEINIGGWFLSDDGSDIYHLTKYQIPDGTTIGSDGYIVFYEDQTFGNPAAEGVNIPFAFSEGGEAAYLHSGQSGQIVGYYQTEESFDASQTGVAFGRYEKPELSGGYDFTRMISPTPGTANSGPAIPDIVITEIHYNPPEGGAYEYVELYNRSGAAVTLMTQADRYTSETAFVTENIPWRLEGTGYEFPTNTTIPAGGRIIVAKDPTVYGGPSASILGPYDGALSNGGEQIELQIPGDWEYGELSRYWIPIEKIDYDDETPWATSPDGGGHSLQRIDEIVDGKHYSSYGRDYSKWQAAAPTPGN